MDVLKHMGRLAGLVVLLIFLIPVTLSFDATTGDTVISTAVSFVDAQTVADNKTNNAANSSGLFSYITDTLNWVISGAFLITITGVIFYFAAWIFDNSIYYFILQTGTVLSTSTGIGAAIEDGWRTIRDIINLTFVFGLIYVAFMTVMKATTHDLKHAIPKILVFAVLINFSLYFAKVIVDVSNITALEIYEQMDRIDGNAAAGTEGVNIAGFFADKLGVKSLIDPEIVEEGQAGGYASISHSLLVSILLLIASFVFIAGAILIAIRFIVIVFLLILSPVAFASGFIPKLNTEEWSHSWWSNMVSQAIFAPAYLMLIWLAMKMINGGLLTGGGTSTLGSSLGGAQNAGAWSNSAGSLINFLLVAGFLVAALIMSKKVGVYGANTATRWGARASFGVTALLGRHTIGWAGSKIASSERLNKETERSGVRGFVARRAMGASRFASTSSFDARNSKTVQAIAHDHNVHLDIGKGTEGGYDGWKEARYEAVKKSEQEAAGKYSVVDDNDPQVLVMKHREHEAATELERVKNEFDQKIRVARDDAKKQVEILKTQRDTALRAPGANVAAINAQFTQDEKVATKGVTDLIAQRDEAVKAQTKIVEAAHKAIEQEKNRSILGSAVTEADMAGNSKYQTIKANIAAQKKTLKDAIHELDVAMQNKDTAAIERHNKEVKDAQDAIKKMEGEQETIKHEYRESTGGHVGYASTVGATGPIAHLTAWVQGRTMKMQQEAAKEVRALKKASGGGKKKEEQKDDGHGHH